MQPEPELVTFVPVVHNKWCGALGAGDVVGATDDGAADGKDVVGAGDGAGHGAADGNDVPINSTMTIPGAPEPPVN